MTSNAQTHRPWFISFSEDAALLRSTLTIDVRWSRQFSAIARMAGYLLRKASGKPPQYLHMSDGKASRRNKVGLLHFLRKNLLEVQAYPMSS